MTINMEIKPLTNIENSSDYINNFKGKYITTKMLTRKYNITPKEAHRLLKFNENTKLSNPCNFGSNKYSNKNLYEIINEKDKQYINKREIENLKKNNINIEHFMKSNFNNLMMRKYHLCL